MYNFIRSICKIPVNPTPHMLDADLFFQDMVNRIKVTDIETLGKAIYKDPHLLHAVMFLHPETIQLLNNWHYCSFDRQSCQKRIWDDIIKTWNTSEEFVDCFLTKLEQPLHIFAKQEFQLLSKEYKDIQETLQHLQKQLPFTWHVLHHIFRDVTQYKYVESKRGDKIFRKIVILEDNGTQTKIDLNKKSTFSRITTV
jgi:hypothetical protein